MIRTGFLKKGGSKLVLPDVNLNRMYVEPALKYLLLKDTEVQISIRVIRIAIKDNEVEVSTDKGKTESFNYVISTAALYDYEGLVINDKQNKTNLDFSSIL